MQARMACQWDHLLVDVVRAAMAGAAADETKNKKKNNKKAKAKKRRGVGWRVGEMKLGRLRKKTSEKAGDRKLTIDRGCSL